MTSGDEMSLFLGFVVVFFAKKRCVIESVLNGSLSVLLFNGSSGSESSSKDTRKRDRNENEVLIIIKHCENVYYKI